MMKKLFLMMQLSALCMVANAGGLMTNTNYHIAFDRMMARGATMEIDGVYSNPAGLVWGHEGWQLSLNFQKPWQNRDIKTHVDGFLGSDFDQKYKGKASAPIVPALFAVYKHDRWAVSSMLGIVGSGGFVQYDDGVPMFNIPIAAKLAQGGVMPAQYTLDSQMKGKQYIYGWQTNFSYKFHENFSAAVGVRVNYYDGYYRGHVVATPGAALATVVNPLINLQLDCLQRGWGVAPIISVNYHKGPLTLSARYEFRTAISTKNDTKTLLVGMTGAGMNGATGYYETDVKATADMIGTEATVQALSGQMGEMAGKVAPYLPNEKTRYDMPALFVLAAGYEFTPKLRAMIEYHFFDDRHAKMGGDRQKTLKDGTHEFLAGVEYDINKKFTVSVGGQRTDYGLKDDYQTHTSFACDSYSVGLGGAYNINERIRLNVSYFCSIYDDYTKKTSAYQDTPYPGTDVFSRTNHVVGVGIDYKF